MSTKEYLGDSVYVEFTQDQVILTTDNGHGPSNTIALDEDTFTALVSFVERVLREDPRGAG
jgi:hypothetical protein